MRTNWNAIMMLTLGSFVVFLFVFASNRNNARKVSKPHVVFVGHSAPFISAETVSKLLIQNIKSTGKSCKEMLDLSLLEEALRANPMVKTAEVYVAVNRTLNAKVEQKTPIARVCTMPSYYVDGDGLPMPLSANYTARVPLVTGTIQASDLEAVSAIAKKVQKDPFLKKRVIEISKSPEGKFYLKLRKYHFLVVLGDITSLDAKIDHLKVFFAECQKHNMFDKYRKIDLEFSNQVVCTKK